ncbi:MAG: hypothetical protein D6690_01995 [Nitrospirae bacterium]|nr:MAG: hypothetical protein D6690_01995 [Nitrospirota bacterium]
MSDDQVFPWWFIALFALGVSLALVLLFPREQVLDMLAETAHPVPETVMFTQNLLRHDPDNEKLRLLLARQYLALGDWEQAWNSVDPLLDHPIPDRKTDAMLLALEIAERQYFSGSSSIGEKERIKTKIVELLRALTSQAVPLELIPSLAESALAIGELAVAQAWYRKGAERATTHLDEWYRKIGDLALAQGAYRQAADAYFSAQAQSHTLAAQRTYYLEGLRALQAGNLLEEALVAAEQHLDGLDRDPSVLEFLVVLGRAAGHGEFAQRYVKQLLRLSQVQGAFEQARIRLAMWKGSVEPSSGQPPALSVSPWVFAEDRLAIFDSRRSSLWPISDRQRVPDTSTDWRPFDDRIYTLAYDVFVENHNLTDAYELAQRAVREVPDHVGWRRRLAQVAEWTGRPRVALDQWRVVAEHKPDRMALERIRQLAPAVYDDESLLFALTELDRHGWLPNQDWRAVVAAFERLGQPHRAVEYLRQRLAEQPHEALLQELADLYQRMGNGAASLEVYSRLTETYGPTVPRAIRRAALLIQYGRLRQAYDVLIAVQALTPTVDRYWALLGDLAWLLQEDDTARAAYRRLWDSRAIAREQTERLIALLQQVDPEQAVAVSLWEWERDGDPALFIRTIDLLIENKRWVRAKDLLQGVSTERLPMVVAHPRYWILRAEVMRNIGNPTEASAAYQHALERDPDNSELRAAWLWFLIDQRELDRLERVVRSWSEDAQNDPILWEPFAAAYLLLDYPTQALPYFQLALRDRGQDYLLLLNYAQALEAAARRAEAWRVRRVAWLQVRAHLLRDPSTEVLPDAIRTAVDIALSQAPTEPFLRWIHDRAASRSDPVLKEMVLSWLLARDRHAAARWWLWINYVRTLDRPAWARLMMALAENDWAEIDAVVTEEEAKIAPHDRIVALAHLRRWPEAQSEAFAALSAQPARQDLHQLFRDTTREQEDALTTQAMIFDRSPLLGYHLRVSSKIDLGQFRLMPRVRVRWQKSADSTELVRVPADELWLGGTLAYPIGQGTLAVTGFYRRAASAVPMFRLQYDHQWSRRAAFSLMGGYNQETDDSVALIVGGVKDEVSGEGSYQFAKRQFLELTVRAAQFYSQTRDRLGSGIGAEGAIGHWFRKQYPDINLRLIGQIQRYSRADALPSSMFRFVPPTINRNIDFAIPNGFEQIGLQVSLGETIRRVHGKGIRVFGHTGVNMNSVFGFGYSLEGGLQTSLFGRDRLIISASQLKGGFGKNATTRQFMLEYHSIF